MPRIAVAVALVSLAGGPAFAPAAPGAKDALATLDQAEALLARADWAGARALLASLPDTGTPLARARRYALLAQAQSTSGQLEAALHAADECERLARGLDAYHLLARAEMSRGNVWFERGFSDRALSHYAKSLELAEASGSKQEIGVALGRLGQGYQAMSDWARVLYYAQRRFALDPDPTDKARFDYRIQRGIAHFELHERDEAERSFREALDIARRMGSRDAIAVALFELGKVYWSFDRDRARALRFYEDALAEALAGGALQVAVTSLNDLGNVNRDSGDPARALAYYERALDLERRRGGGRMTPFLLKNTGQVLVRLGRREDGERSLLKALALADEQKVQRIQWQARMELAQLYRDQDPARADRYFAETLDVIEAQHSNVLLDDLRAANLAVSLSFYNPYELSISFLLEQQRPAEAFLVAERARARAFLATLSAAREQVAGAVPADYLEAEKQILRRISEGQTVLRTSAPADSRRQDLLAALRGDEDELTALRIQLAVNSPQVAQARYPHLWTVEELQAKVLQPREALAVFFLGESASVCWILTREDLATVPLPARAEVESVVRAALEALRSPGAEAQPSARRVHDMLAAPIVERVPEGWRLVVVAHGILNYLPLETALDPEGRYLIERHPTSYAPSASSWAYLRALPTEASHGSDIVLAVGDPMVGSSVPGAERALDPDLVAFLKPLAHAAEELRRISSVFGGASLVLAGERATEAELSRLDGRRVRILHFATHGLVDDRRPDRSALALTAQPPDGDGLLQTREVFRLRLKARLVTLSACQTALGKELTGEGLVGLARAFFYAGANAVMASLWSVSDASTARWMGDFYTRLRAGDAIDEAARAAKSGFIRGGGALAHPYHWAPFIVTGNAAGGVELRPRSRAPLIAMATAVLLGGSVAAYLTARVRRRRAGPRTS